jgi:Flp pilus assembly protein protease CpaA
MRSHAAAKVALLTTMIVAIHLCWLLVAATFARILRDPVSSRIANLLLAAGLVATMVLALVK